MMIELIVIIVIVSLVFGGAFVILVAFVIDMQNEKVEEKNDLNEWVEDRNDVIF